MSVLSEKTKNAILALQKKYPKKRSALIPALHLAQAENGYLSREIQQNIADLFDLELNEINAVITFYDMFFEEPVGKHILHICKNASCMLRGADQILENICSKLQIKPGETTKDQEFTVIASECLGACDLAPMMLVDERVVGPVQEDQVDKILREAKNGSGHPSPMEKVGISNE